jgi:hypothetical protein
MLALFAFGPVRSIGEGIMAFLIVVPVILVFTCVLTAIPAALVIWLSEKFRIRSALFFGCTGAAIAVVGQAILFQPFSFSFAGLFVVAGFLAGFDYWLVSGKHAGREPS